MLEPMCGTGCFLIPFLEAGAEIDGLDASPYMLAECRKKCAVKGLEPTLYQQLLEDISLPRKYGFIFIPNRSFAHLYEKEVAQACLKKLWDYLLPGGRLVLDIKTPPGKGEFGTPGETAFWVEDRDDDSTILGTSLWAEREGGRIIRQVTKYELYVDESLVTTELFDYNERFYDAAEFEGMLHSAGFADIKATKAYKVTEPTEHDTIVFSCRKC